MSCTDENQVLPMTTNNVIQFCKVKLGTGWRWQGDPMQYQIGLRKIRAEEPLLLHESSSLCTGYAYYTRPSAFLKHLYCI